MCGAQIPSGCARAITAPTAALPSIWLGRLVQLDSASHFTALSSLTHLDLDFYFAEDEVGVGQPLWGLLAASAAAAAGRLLQAAAAGCWSAAAACRHQASAVVTSAPPMEGLAPIRFLLAGRRTAAGLGLSCERIGGNNWAAPEAAAQPAPAFAGPGGGKCIGGALWCVIHRSVLSWPVLPCIAMLCLSLPGRVLLTAPDARQSRPCMQA